MIYLKLFLTFLEIGAVSFGGGYGMISLIRELTIANGWLTEDQLMNFIAVSESTPGPIAINMATFVGASQAKCSILGAACATLGVILPSVIIILFIVAVLRRFLQYRAVQGALTGIRPCVVGLIFATAASMLLSNLFSFKTVGDRFSPNFIGIGIFLAVAAVAFVWKRLKKKNISPILLIVISAVLGGVLYSI